MPTIYTTYRSIFVIEIGSDTNGEIVDEPRRRHLENGTGCVFCALEFRLHRLDRGSHGNKKPLLWSCLIATPDNSRITPESLLSPEQPQKVKPSVFPGSTALLRNIRLKGDGSAIRIKLNEASEVTAKDSDNV